MAIHPFAARACLTASILFFMGCSHDPNQELDKLTNQFVYATLAFSPATATGAGLHQYQRRNLDDELDDLSPASLDKQRTFYEDFRKRLGTLDAGALTPEGRVDLRIMNDQAALNLLDLSEIHSHLHNPTVYVETLGNALFNCYVLNYAPLPQRIQNIISRLQKAPLFLDQASTNLSNSAGVWISVAISENQGNIDLVDKTIRAVVPASLTNPYSRAAEPALAAMRKFQDYLKNGLSQRNDYNWRLGSDLYTRKFRLTMEAGVEAPNVLQSAERDLDKVRAEMLALAEPLAREWKLSPHTELTGEERENSVIGEVLDRIAGRHSTRQSYMDDARTDLEEARAFVEAKRIVTLPPLDNLKVIPTPDFMRGVYSVGGFSPAPPLEPQLGAFYWVTPIPDNWPQERVESKLREYNFYKLKLLTLHEAMPGHYVQMQVASAIQPQSRRLLRSLYGNDPYIEGWAQFAEETMLGEGFLDHSPEMALTFAKERLRVIANAILDVRLQMLEMTDQDALDLMEKRTFQEKEEAEEKLQRAKLTSCQLPTYYVGWSAWDRLRDEYKKSKGAAYRPGDFNDRALKEGAAPLASLGALLGG
jgi:uncharacterized protein (DUF885 family)